jgi:heterodisulfide reductase subunit A-like polyferredoxin
MTESEVINVSGYVGNFSVKVKRNEETTDVPAGAIIVATGFETFDPHRKPELGYGKYPQVVTTLDFEQTFNRKSEIVNPKSIVFIQCVGSRDQTNGNSYCSRVCCMVTAKQARLVREQFPNANVTVFYMDVRAFGKGFEEFYDHAREDGVMYRRGNPSEILKRGDKVVVRAEDTLLGELVEVEADLVVLAVGMKPRGDSGAVAQLLKLSRSGDGFFHGSASQTAPGGNIHGGSFPRGLLSITKRYCRFNFAGARGCIRRDDPTHARTSASGRGDFLHRRGTLLWVRAMRGLLQLLRAGSSSRARQDDCQRGVMSGLRRVRHGLPVEGDQSPSVHVRAGHVAVGYDDQ